MNTIPEWFTVDLDESYVVEHRTRGWKATYTGRQLHEGLSVEMQAGEEALLRVQPL
jgi:hypothetical protein